MIFPSESLAFDRLYKGQGLLTSMASFSLSENCHSALS